MAGLIGHGDAFVLRDPSGIRPAFYYHDEEVAVMASERPAIQTAFDVHVDDVKELKRGHALIIKKNGAVSEKPCKDQLDRSACSFERIYFSRGNDRDIYKERKILGRLLVEDILKEIKGDFKHTVFSFIPNTAEVAFYGLMNGLHERLNEIKSKKILAGKRSLSAAEVKEILSLSPRIEKLALKDEKLRTFIADDTARGEMVSHVYDVTYGIIENEVDTVVVLDDSIVRGTTLRDSIIEILSRLRPKKIIIVSSAPQIRYPDCYGIDMSKMGEFAAFQALVSLLKKDGKEEVLQKAYQCALAQEERNEQNPVNVIKEVYEMYPYEQISDKISEILTPQNTKCEVKIIYQTVESLHKACPNNQGDWYFTGNYPTPGGNRVVNKALINYMENKDERAY